MNLHPEAAAWVGAWAPAWAAMLRPIVSAIATMLSTAVVQRRTRRVIVTSSISVHPRARGSPGIRRRTRPGLVPARGRSRPGSAPLPTACALGLVNGVEADSGQDGVGG